MKLKDHLDKNSLHHAYLIEGSRDEVVPEILSFLKDFGIKIVGNADLSHVSLDSFKTEDARNLKSYGEERGVTSGKRIFIISANHILLEAQNSLLKMLEEPIENTHFFFTVPDANALLKTFVSRFYLITNTRQDLVHAVDELGDVEKFIGMSLQDRINFIQKLLIESDDEDEEGNKIVAQDSARTRAILFLNTLELVLHKKIFNNVENERSEKDPHALIPFRQIFLARRFLRQPGSSAKILLESVALVVPSF